MGKDLILCDTDVIIDYLDETQSRHFQTFTYNKKDFQFIKQLKLFTP